MNEQPRVSKSAFIILSTQIEKIRERVFDGIPKELRKEMTEELRDLRKETMKENGITRKLVVSILISIILSFAVLIAQERLSSRTQYVEIQAIKNSLDAHRNNNEIPD